MKSKRRKRIIAVMLCMVLAFSTGISTIAEAEPEATPATVAAEPETKEAAVQSAEADAQTQETQTQQETTSEPQTQEEPQTAEESGQTETAQAEQEQQKTQTEDATQTEEVQTQEETAGQKTETQGKTAAETKEASEEQGGEEKRVSPAFQETYEDNQIQINVTAKEGIIPEGAKLSVTPIVKKEVKDSMSEEEKANVQKVNAQYDLTEKKLSEDSEDNKNTMEGFLAYDISFLVDGQEVEPNGDVKVVMNFKEAIAPEGVSENAEVSIKHLKEDTNVEDGVVVEDMGDKSNIQTTEKAEVEKVEFTAESFSVFTIGWTYGGETSKQWTFRAEAVDDTGDELGYKPDGKYYSGSSANVEDLARFLIGKDGIQDYKLEYVAIDNWNKKPNPSITKMGLSQGKTYYQYADGERKNIENNEVYFVFSKRPELKQVDTEDTISKGIRIDVFDYQVGQNGEEDTTQSGMKESGINKGRTLKFISDRIDDGYNSSGLKTGDSSIVQDLLKDEENKVSELGNPILKNGESLKYLFDDTNNSNAKQSYLNVNNLFQKDENGYYFFDSAQNYAYLNQNSMRFEVYNQPGSGFFPFTTTDNMFEPKTVQENAKIGGEGMNHYLGMTVTSDFLQPENGQIQGSDGTLQNMRFDFTGDDDVWVYIDGVLVMDLGGIHSPQSGWIDFATGEVSAGGNATSIYERFINALGRDAADLFEQIPDTDNYRFKDFSYHTIKFFYLERGNDQSNCKITFNLQTVPEGSVLVTKEVKAEDNTGINEDYLNSLDFQFQIEKMNKSGNNEGELSSGILKGQDYTVFQDGKEVGSGTTDQETGLFTLKAGQTALFKGFLKTDQYQVKELGAYLEGYQVDIEIPGVEIGDPEGGESQEPAEGWNTGIVTVSEAPSVIFTNTASAVSTFEITKKLGGSTTDNQTVFKIEVKIQGEVYKGEYTIEGKEGKQSASEGYIQLKAGETAQITGLPYGTSFEVLEELEDDSYFPSYSINGDVYDQILPDLDLDEENNNINSVSGKVLGNCEVVVTNTKVAGEDLPYIEVQKTFEGITNPEQQVPNFQIDILNSDKVQVRTLNLKGAEKSEDGLTYTWRLNDLEEGTYYIKESGETIAGYEVTIKVNGTDVVQKDDYFQVITQKPIFHVEKLNDQIDSNSENDFKFDENNFIAAILKDQTCFVWTEETLSLGEREAIVELVKEEAHGNLSGKITVSNTRFYSTTDRIEAGIDLGFGEICVKDGKLSFTHPSQWQHVIAGLYTRTNEVNAEIELINHYDPNDVQIDLQKYGTDYKKQYDGAVFELFCGQKEDDELKWDTSNPVENFNQIAVSSSNKSELNLMPGFYMLQEVKAPDGFRKLEDPIYFKIEAGKVELIDESGVKIDDKQSMWELKTDGGIVLKIKNNVVYSLPSAGGPGIFLYTIGGVLLLMAGSLILYKMKRGEVLKK